MKCWHEKKKQVKLVPDTISGIRTSLSNLSDLSNMCDTTSTGTWKIGRPAGSTKTKKEETEKNIILAKNEIAKSLHLSKMQQKRERERERVKHGTGTLVRLINEVKEKRGVSVGILPSAIRRRLGRQSLHSHHLAGGQVSELAKIEPTIIGIVIQMARIRQEEMIVWKATNTPNTTGIVGRGY